MRRTSLVPLVGIPLGRALVCPNDDTVYDAAGWKACPTCQNEERVFLSRLIGLSGAPHPLPGFAMESEAGLPWRKRPARSLTAGLGRASRSGPESLDIAVRGEHGRRAGRPTRTIFV